MNQFMEAYDSLHNSCNDINIAFEKESGITWFNLIPRPRPCISLGVLADHEKGYTLLGEINRSSMEEGKEPPFRYAVYASLIPGVFNYGGDLELLIDCIKNGDRNRLRAYAQNCIEDVHLISVNLNQPLTSMALAQGAVLGGGFELALACNVIVAEKQAQFGLPEILFNLFPGMGAYSILARKIGSVQAEKIITSGSLYSASEMHELGVVDVLVEDGEGRQAIYDFAKKNDRKHNAYQSILKVRQKVNGITLKELLDIGEIWLDTAMNIGPRELKIMERLMKTQERNTDYPDEVLEHLNIGAQASSRPVV